MKPVLVTKWLAALAVVSLLSPVWVWAANVSSSYDGATGNLTVTITGDGSSQWNDLRVQCKSTDAAGAFATAAPWSVTSTEVIGTKTYVKLDRSSVQTANETIVITGPKGRGFKGSIYATLNGQNQFGAGGVPTFTDVDDLSPLVPAATPITLAFMAALLGAAGLLYLYRRRGGFSQA